MLAILAYLCLLGCFICAIMVLVKLFQEKGVLHGILGLICGLYTFIWGWINSGRLGIRNIMLIWTLLIILYMILGTMSGALHFSYGGTTSM